MIWKPCILQKKRKTGEDALKNPIYDWVDVKRTRVMETPWTDEQIALEDRDTTRNEQRFAIPVPYPCFPKKCERAVIDGHSQEITQIIDLSPRYTVIQVKVYKE